MKFYFAVSPKELALPLEIVYDFHKSYWVVMFRVLWFMFQFVYVSKQAELEAELCNHNKWIMVCDDCGEVADVPPAPKMGYLGNINGLGADPDVP